MAQRRDGSTRSGKTDPATPTTSTVESEITFRRKVLVRPRTITGQGVKWKEILWLLPVVTLAPYFCSKLHYDLPTLITNGSPEGLPAIPSEANIRTHIQALQDIGYRTVGTSEAVEGEVYVYEEVKRLQKQCQDLGTLECDVWLQEGSGQHQFDIMEHAVLKSYQGIRNVILRIRGPNTTTTISGEDMQNAVLLNAHIDSALPAPGAADDALGVGVMLDCARVLIERNQPITGAAVFLFNGAEETLQDASHLYSTSHETRHSIRTVINLEAAGSSGPATLFQAGSREMIEAYSHTPRPSGNSIGDDVFKSGIIMSDTDYVQFQRYLNISGLDSAIVGRSYTYHTRSDTVENLQVGSAQHFGDSTMALLDFLLREGSPLNSDLPWHDLDVVYFSLYDRIFIYYYKTTALFLAIGVNMAWIALLFARSPSGSLPLYARATASVFVSFVAALLSAVSTAGFMAYVLRRSLTWFRHEHTPMLLYGIPALTGALACQHLILKGSNAPTAILLEHATAYGVVGFFALNLMIAQSLGFASAYLLFNTTLIGTVLLLVNEAMTMVRGKRIGMVYFAPIYIAWTAFSIFTGTEAVTNFLDVFAPLMGRVGVEAPADIIISVLSGSIAFVFTPMAIPLFHRCSSAQKPKVLIGMTILTGLTMAYFANRQVYDATHPKRIGVQYLYNVSSGDTTMHLAQMDSGPGFQDLLAKVHNRYGSPTASIVSTEPSDLSSDWDVLYPISAFVHSEKWVMENAPAPLLEKLPVLGLSLVQDVYDEEKRVRTITIDINHQGLIYPVLAFSAEVISWSFESAPPVGRDRHYIKAAASPGHEAFQVTMQLKLEEGQTVGFHWVGIDANQMFPATSTRLGPDLPSTAIFADMDAWLEEEWKSSLDVLMIGVIAGVVEV